MAKNSGETRGSAIAAIQAGQMAVGASIAGSSAAVSSPADIEQTTLLGTIKEIGKDTYDSISNMANTMAEMLAFDKDAFRREMDARREKEKEGFQQAMSTNMAIKGPSKEDIGMDLPKLVLGGLAALAYFAKELNFDEFLRLPQQLKSMRAMAKFAKGIGTIGTLGFGPKILDGIKSFFKSIDLSKFRGNIAKLFEPLTRRLTDFKNKVLPRTVGGSLIDDITKFFTDIGKKVRDAFKAVTQNKVITSIGKTLQSAFRSISVTLKPIIDTVRGLFAGEGMLSKILEPLKKVGRFIGKLFLPITLILGVIDGVQGFMKGFEEDGIIGGIKGAISGIIEGFVGGFVRLIGSAFEWVLGLLGLDSLGAMVNERINSLMDSFMQTFDGIMDFIIGIFTFDGERIMTGLGNMFGGVGTFFLNLLTAPIDMAVNFLKDIFGFGDPDKPFSLKGFLLGDENGPGIVGRIWEWFKGLFKFDFSGLKSQFSGIWSIMKGLAAGGWAAVKAMLPGGESPGEAFNRVFSEYVDKGTLAAAAGIDMGSDGGEPAITKVTTENSAGDVTETTYKTNTINNNGGTQTGNVYIDNSNNSNNQSSSVKKADIYSAPLNTGIDSYHDREAWNMGA